MHAQVADYLAAGTIVVWVADPVVRTVRVYRDLLAPVTLTVADTLTADDLLPGFRLPVRDVFE